MASVGAFRQEAATTAAAPFSGSRRSFSPIESADGWSKGAE